MVIAIITGEYVSFATTCTWIRWGALRRWMVFFFFLIYSTTVVYNILRAS